MVDSYSISSEFGFNGLHITKAELDKLPETVNLLLDETISRANEKSPFYAKCLRQLFALCDDSVQVLFSESVEKRIRVLCKKEEDDEFLGLYESLFEYVRDAPQLESNQTDTVIQNLLEVFKNKILPCDVDLLKDKSKAIGHFPLYLALDRFFRNTEPLVNEFALNTSFIYYKEGKKEKPATYLRGDALKALNKLQFQFDRFEPPVRRYFKDFNRVYKNLLYSEINSLEGTSFSQSFVCWVQWKYGGACFLGNNNPSYPAWCFSHRCMALCFSKKESEIKAFKSLYVHIADKLSIHREKASVMPLEALLQYEEDSCATRLVFDETSGKFTRERIPNIIHKVSPSKSVTEEAKRLIRSIGHGLTIEGKNLIVPAGDAIDIPREQKKTPKVSFEERRLKYEEKIAKRALAEKVKVEGSPIIERFIAWAKKQDWYDDWAALYNSTFNEDPESHLHSLGVAKALNNSIPGRDLYKVLYHLDFYFKNEKLGEILKKAENDFIASDRKRAVQALAQELSSSEHGVLLKTATEVFEHFGLDAPHVTNGSYLLAESLDKEGLGYAPVDYKNYICIYTLPTAVNNLVQSSWRWKDTYAAQLSLITMAALMVKASELKVSDIKQMDDFLSLHKVDKSAKPYLLGSFLVYARECATSYPYDFSNLRGDEKEEYYKVLEGLAEGDSSRETFLKEYKHRFV